MKRRENIAVGKNVDGIDSSGKKAADFR